jgi:hypothetical protein
MAKKKQKKIVVEFVFDIEVEDDWENPVISEIGLVSTDFTEDELSGIGETIAQTDHWQVDVWNSIQTVLGGDSKRVTVDR